MLQLPGPTSTRRFRLEPALKAQYKLGADLKTLQSIQSLVRSTGTAIAVVIS